VPRVLLERFTDALYYATWRCFRLVRTSKRPFLTWIQQSGRSQRYAQNNRTSHSWTKSSQIAAQELSLASGQYINIAQDALMILTTARDSGAILVSAPHCLINGPAELLQSLVPRAKPEPRRLLAGGERRRAESNPMLNLSV